jgi:hypothetical protein
MSIPNVTSLSKRIKEGSEGGNAFARFLNLLLIEESKKEGKKITTFSDAAGDYKGVDCIISEEHDYTTGYQFKFYPSPLSSKHKTKIIEAIRSGINKFGGLRELTIVTPDDLNIHDLSWFMEVEIQEAKKVKMPDADIFEIKTLINHMGHSHIVSLALKFPFLGKKYFPELFNYDIDLFRLIKYTKDDDLLFDFTFLNDSSFTYLLNSIDVIFLESWSSLSGLPEERHLKSSGKIVFEVNMRNEINTKKFDDPVILPPLKPFRFYIQLLNFYETMPGSSVKFKFRFHFNNGEFFMDSEPTTISG